MNNGSKELQISEEHISSYLSSGWKIGRLRSGKIVRWMHKDDLSILVNVEEIDSYLEKGYEFGKPRWKNEKYTYVIKNNKEKRIKLNDLEKYIACGWTEGILNQHYMHNDSKIVLVQPDEFIHYKNSGYIFGSTLNR